MLPSLFLNHGSPFMAQQESDYTRFLGELGRSYKPKAIVLFSAHWEERVTTISFAQGPLETIYDFYGFPDELYQLTYPAPGSPKLAEELEKRFNEQHIRTNRHNTRGLDHGSWIFLRYMYPEADIPIVTVSVNPFLPVQEQLAIGESLRGLGEDDILVIGSGTTIHNLNEIKWGQQEPEPWALAFDDWLIDKVENQDRESLMNYGRLAPHALRAVPRAEHFIPLFQAMGSGDAARKPRLIYRGYEMGSFSLTCFEF
jgi:4,5-DOPA dioxygenase extradiol